VGILLWHRHTHKWFGFRHWFDFGSISLFEDSDGELGVVILLFLKPTFCTIF